jgi:hypothetical protein
MTEGARPAPLTLSRTQRIERDLHCGRPVSDADLLQHRNDCCWLMELAHMRFLVTGDAKDLQEARGWMCRRDEAVQRLSPTWKASREAQIQCSIGAAYFIEQGEQSRAQIAANEAVGG